MLRKVVASLLNSTPDRLEKIRSALASGDRRQLAWESHALEGVFSTIGAKTLAMSSRTLTSLSKEDDMTGIGAVFQGLDDDWQRLRNDLTRLLEQPGPDAPTSPPGPSSC